MREREERELLSEKEKNKWEGEIDRERSNGRMVKRAAAKQELSEW